MKKRDTKSEFLLAAEAFDDELDGFHRALEAALSGPLGSAKQLERAAQSLTQVVQCEQRLSVASQALSRAITNAHEEQVAHAQKGSARAQVVAERTAKFQYLMEGYRALGVAVMSLNSEAAELSRKKRELGDKAPETALAADITALQDKMTAVAQTAQQLLQTARAAEFDDVARQVESLRQQLLAVHNKLSLLNRSFPAN